MERVRVYATEEEGTFGPKTIPRGGRVYSLSPGVLIITGCTHYHRVYSLSPGVLIIMHCRNRMTIDAPVPFCLWVLLFPYAQGYSAD